MNWPLNHWIMTKVAKHLGEKEGCDIIGIEATKKGVEMTLRDSFGYIYEMNIKTISREAYNDDEVSTYDRPSHTAKEITK